MRTKVTQTIEQLQRQLRTEFPQCTIEVVVSSCNMFNEENKTFDQKFIAEFGLCKHEKAGPIEDGKVEVKTGYHGTVHADYPAGVMIRAQTQTVSDIKKGSITYSK